jgi:hypothetical protein
VKGLVFLIGSFVYGLIGIFIYMQVLLQCGLGPDSPVACNERVDEQLPFVIPALVIVYIIGALLFWRRRSKGQS